MKPASLCCILVNSFFPFIKIEILLLNLLHKITRYRKKMGLKGILGRRQSKKNLSSYLDNNYTGRNLSDITMLELWSLLKVKACNSQGKPWPVNCAELWSISAMSTVAATHTPWQDLCTCSWSSLHTNFRSQVA